MRNSLARLDPETIDEITTRLREAPNLSFPGLRNSHFFAICARWQFIQFRAKTRQLPGAGETIAERIADLGPGDMVMVVPVRRLVGKANAVTQGDPPQVGQWNIRRICGISPSIRACAVYSTKTSARATMPRCSAVLPGQSPPCARP